MSGVNWYGGIAFDFVDEHNVDIWAFVGGCTTKGGDFAVGIDAGLGLFRNVEGIDGFSTYFSMGVSFFGLFSAGSSWAYDNNCQISGMSTTAGVGPSWGDSPIVSLDVGFGHCINFNRTLLRRVALSADSGM